MTWLGKTHFLSIEDYLAGEEDSPLKHEYLGGAVHAMAGGSADHAAISANAIGSLITQLRGKPCRTFTSDLKVRIDLPEHTRFYYPDVQVVCQPGAGDTRYQDRPSVVVEVLSESTRRIDLGEKKDASYPRSRCCCWSSPTSLPSSFTAAAPREVSPGKSSKA